VVLDLGVPDVREGEEGCGEDAEGGEEGYAEGGGHFLGLIAGELFRCD
jgi:hypothetical protein